ncbi:hypothetical protein [uncultured Aquimarina sp.]|uniref:hypothetical protein n=1 Tax=uncultured Aquimarina sp. TaxID=575652 RepID=UPI00260A647D|nr:hypothetical protein [uncultured Aquimarina sp.]
MKHKSLLLLFLLAIGQLSIAQEETLRPSLNFYDDNLALNNFPAISEDRSHYLILYNEYSCCIETEEVLQKISTKNGRILNEIVIYPGSEATQFTAEQQKGIYDKVLKLLKSSNYTTLKRIPTYNHMYDDDKNTFLAFEIKKETFKSEKIDLPRLGAHGFCCNGGTDLNENCLLYQSIINAWFSKEHNFLLIESGIHHGMNGCDQGPFYKVIQVAND